MHSGLQVSLQLRDQLENSVFGGMFSGGCSHSGGCSPTEKDDPPPGRPRADLTFRASSRPPETGRSARCSFTSPARAVSTPHATAQGISSLPRHHQGCCRRARVACAALRTLASRNEHGRGRPTSARAWTLVFRHGRAEALPGFIAHGARGLRLVAPPAQGRVRSQRAAGGERPAVWARVGS